MFIDIKKYVAELNDFINKTAEKNAPESEIDREGGFYSVVNLMAGINQSIYGTAIDKKIYSSKDDSNIFSVKFPFKLKNLFSVIKNYTRTPSKTCRIYQAKF